RCGRATSGCARRSTASNATATSSSRRCAAGRRWAPRFGSFGRLALDSDDQGVGAGGLVVVDDPDLDLVPARPAEDVSHGETPDRARPVTAPPRRGQPVGAGIRGADAEANLCSALNSPIRPGVHSGPYVGDPDDSGVTTTRADRIARLQRDGSLRGA